MKTYTDLRCEMEDVVLSGGMGLEPIFAQVCPLSSRVCMPTLQPLRGQNGAQAVGFVPATSAWLACA